MAQPDPLSRETSTPVRPRCKGCGCWLTPIGIGDHTCSNSRCDQSWQAARRQFESSMLGAAVRQVIGERRADA